jgi:hypothetical protein
MFRTILIIAVIVNIGVPFIVHGQVENVPEEYRDEIRSVLLSGTIGSDVSIEEFEAFVDTLSTKAYNANVTGADLNNARVEALLGAAAGFDTPVGGNVTGEERKPDAGMLWGAVALVLLIGYLTRFWTRLYHGGALGH